DTYGDGICCDFGNGAYTINVNGTDVAAGGNFTTSTTEQFCGDAGDGEGDGGDDGGGDANCTAIDFTNTPPQSYGSIQDRGTVTILDANTIMIQNNAWKAIDLDYSVTPATVIEFEFGSTRQGEIHGIGFDNNNSISSNRTFRLFGTQTWGLSNFDTYSTIGYWKSYILPVGQFYSGNFNRLFFVADHDGGARNGNSFFRNIRIYEGSACVGAAPVAGEPITTTPQDAMLTSSQSLQVFPNPTNDLLNVDLQLSAANRARVRMVDLSGRTVRQQEINLVAGDQRLALPVDNLPVGMYLLRIDTSSGYAATTKFTVAR
ncbi:MAG: T9SS type A sorting domain-containing protein, partial [Bacteroidota bacterium]